MVSAAFAQAVAQVASRMGIQASVSQFSVATYRVTAILHTGARVFKAPVDVDMKCAESTPVATAGGCLLGACEMLVSKG